MKVQITNPCSKNWNKMTDADGGRYCSFCDKVVVDFTHMNTEEIKRYFLSHCGQKICGHVNTSQLYFKEGSLIRRLLDMKESLLHKASLGIAGRVALSLVGMALVMAGCEMSRDGKMEITGDSLGLPEPERQFDSINRAAQPDSLH